MKSEKEIQRAYDVSLDKLKESFLEGYRCCEYIRWLEMTTSDKWGVRFDADGNISHCPVSYVTDEAINQMFFEERIPF